MVSGKVDIAQTIKPKILLVGKRPPDYGGVSAVIDVILNSAAILDKYSIVVVSTTHRGRHVETEKSRLRFIYILRRIRLLFILLYRSLTLRPDLVHYHTGGDLSFVSDAINVMIFKMLGRKVIMHYHTNPQHQLTLFPPLKQHGMKWAIFRHTVNRCDLFITLGENYRNRVRSLPGIEAERVEYLYNTLPPSFLTSAPPLPTSRVKTQSTNVVFLGRLSEQKGFFDVLYLAERCEATGLDVRFLVAGTSNSDRDEKAITYFITSRSLRNITFLGQVHGAPKLELLANADVLILPSRYEGFPITILEAAAFGVPSVVYDVGMMKDIVVHNETGLIVTPFSKDELYCAIQELSDDWRKCRRLGEGARMRLSLHFNAAIFETRLLKMYEHTLTADGS